MDPRSLIRAAERRGEARLGINQESVLALKWMLVRVAMIAGFWSIPSVIARAPVEQVIAMASFGFFLGSTIAVFFAIKRAEQISARHFNTWDEAMVLGGLCLVLRLVHAIAAPS
jgi:hypothetical protein